MAPPPCRANPWGIASPSRPPSIDPLRRPIDDPNLPAGGRFDDTHAFFSFFFSLGGNHRHCRPVNLIPVPCPPPQRLPPPPHCPVRSGEPSLTPPTNPPRAPPAFRKRITLLGSTGSIGTQTLDIVALCPQHYSVVGLAAGPAPPFPPVALVGIGIGIGWRMITVVVRYGKVP